MEPPKRRNLDMSAQFRANAEKMADGDPEVFEELQQLISEIAKNPNAGIRINTEYTPAEGVKFRFLNGQQVQRASFVNFGADVMGGTYRSVIDSSLELTFDRASLRVFGDFQTFTALADRMWNEGEGIRLTQRLIGYELESVDYQDRLRVVLRKQEDTIELVSLGWNVAHHEST